MTSAEREHHSAEHASEHTVNTGLKNWAHSPDFDGVIVRRAFRQSSIFLARYLPQWVTPNLVTVLGFSLTIPAFFLFLQGTYLATALAGTLGFLSYFFDFIDGSLARIRNSGNIYGQWLDMYFGRIGVFILFLGATWNVYLQNESYFTWLWGFLAYTAALMVGSMYNSFHRLVPAQAKEYIAVEKKKHWIIPNFYYVEVFYYPLLFIAAVADQLYYFLIFCAIYGWIFTLGTFYLLGKKVKKEAKV